MPDLPLHSRAPELQARSPLPSRHIGAARQRVRIFVVLGFLLVGAGSAQAQVRGTSDYLQRMDANRDGRVALVEYQDWMSYAFDRMDANADGVLAAAELPGSRGKPITREQYRQRIALTFARQDGNGDGFLDARELASPPQ